MLDASFVGVTTVGRVSCLTRRRRRSWVVKSAVRCSACSPAVDEEKVTSGYCSSPPLPSLPFFDVTIEYDCLPYAEVVPTFDVSVVRPATTTSKSRSKSWTGTHLFVVTGEHCSIASRIDNRVESVLFPNRYRRPADRLHVGSFESNASSCKS